MAAKNETKETLWYENIDRKRRPNFLAILEELSRRQGENPPEFILIGAMALLMQHYLPYVAWWDIDLLFRDKRTLRDFADTIETEGLAVKPLDDGVIVTKNLECLHTMWSFGHTWANVDYIYRPDRFKYFYETIRRRAPFSEEVSSEGRQYHLQLMLGNAWDIFVDKLTLPRMVEQIQTKDVFGIDLRHIVHILRKDHTKPQFWRHITKRSRELGREGVLRLVLIRLTEILPELGYEIVSDPQEVVRHFDP